METNKTFNIGWQIFDKNQFSPLDWCSTRFDLEDFYGCIDEKDVLDVIEEEIRLIFKNDIYYKVDRKEILSGVAKQILKDLKDEQD